MSKNKCEWEWKKLGEVCDSINGLWKGKKEPFVKVCVIRNTNFTKDCKLNLDADKLEILDVEKKQYASRKLQYGDLIIEKSGGSEKQPVGRAILFEETKGEYSFSNFTSVLRIKDTSKISCHFLHSQLYKLYLDGVTKSMQPATTGIHNLEFDKYKQLDIAVPPLAEQERLVNVLDDAFAKIDKIKTDAETNLQNAKDLFQTTLANNFAITEEKKEWNLYNLEDIVSEDCSMSYGIVQPGDDVSNGVPVVRPVDLRSKNLYSIDSLKRTSQKISDSYKRTILNGGEILMCVRGTTGVVSIVSEAFKNCNVTRGIVPFRFGNKTNTSFMFYAFTCQFVASQIQEQTRGAALKQINIKDLKKVKIPLPPLPIQKQIVAKLDSLSEKVKQLESNYKQVIADCDELKKSILKKAFEGNL